MYVMEGIGCDPEVFITDEKGEIISGIGLIGGTKEDPRGVNCGAVQEDNVLPSDSNTTLKSNKIVMHTVEMPIELRFSTSTPHKYRFWKIYPGSIMAYVFATNTNLRQREDFDVEEVVEINDFLYGLTLSTGFNKWNLHVYYGLNEIFNNTIDNSYNFNIQDIRLGLIFYML